MTLALTFVYLVAALLAGAFGVVELRLLYRYWKSRAALDATDPPPGGGGFQLDDPPAVTIQIPLYNERTAAARAIEAAARQDYPRHRFDIQVLDDSDDETPAIVARLVERWRRRGVRIHHIRRPHRRGFKAGALAEGLARSAAEFVAVFDADFAPAPDFLRRVLLESGAFADPAVGFVQARWGFEERNGSLLTAAQALLMDRHFFVQKPTKERYHGVTTFNGSGGIWRRAAIDAAGGWSADTLTEDFDLSFRSALTGWRGRYLRDVFVPSELPGEMSAFKSQQRRWSQGSAQTARKLLARVVRARGALADPLDEAFLLASYAIHPLLLANTLLWPLAVRYMDRGLFLVLQGFMGLGLLAAALSMLVTLRARGDAWTPRSLGLALASLAVGIGLMVNNTAGQLAGLLRRGGTFARTPKRVRTDLPEELRTLGAGRPYREPLHWTFWAELATSAYCVGAAVWLAKAGEALWAVPLIFWAGCLVLVAALQLLPPRAAVVTS